MTTNRKQWATGALVAAALLTGCGAAASSTTTTSGAGTGAGAGVGAKGNPVLDAYQNTVADKTASLSLKATVTGAAAQPVTVSATGAVDFSSGAAQFTMSVPSAGSFNMRLLQPMMYMQFPSSLASALPAGKSWVSINLDKIGSSGIGQGLSQLSNSANLGTDMLSSLEGVSSSGVTTVGPATIGGIQTTEYSATIDLSKISADKDAQARAALQQLGSEVHLSSIPVQVWIDAQGQVRQISLQESLTVKGAPVESQVTIGLSDFGAPVDVVAPPAGETIDISSIPGASSSF